MKKLIMSIVVCLSAITSSNAEADNLYRVTVSRKDADVYTFVSGISSGVIITQYCYEYAFNDDAVLKYDAYSYDNKLIFSSGTTCDVKGLLIK